MILVSPNYRHSFHSIIVLYHLVSITFAQKDECKALKYVRDELSEVLDADAVTAWKPIEKFTDCVQICCDDPCCTGYGFVYHNGGWRCSLLKQCNTKEECKLVARQGFGTIFIQRVEAADGKKCAESTTTSKTSDKTTGTTTKKKDDHEKSTTKHDEKKTTTTAIEKGKEKEKEKETTKKPTKKKSNAGDVISSLEGSATKLNFSAFSLLIVGVLALVCINGV